jgi:deoxycytidylate deaminase
MTNALGIPIEDSWLHKNLELVDFTINKRDVTIHAEENALLAVDSRSRLEDATMVVTHLPCPRCLSKILHSGIRYVVYGNGEVFHQQENIVKDAYIIEKSKRTLIMFQYEGLRSFI